MDKYIKLSFKNAKIFPYNIRTKDRLTPKISFNKKGKVFYGKSLARKDNNQAFKEPITVHQISNMLHTFIGERPIPSFRYTFYNRDEKIFEIANNSYIKINSPKITKVVKKEEFKDYISENITINKANFNAWAKPTQIKWFQIKKLLGDNYNTFLNIINDILNRDVTLNPFEDLFLLYEKEGEKIEPLITYLKSLKKTNIINFFSKPNFDRSEITRAKPLHLTIGRGVDRVYVLDGEIIIPYDDYIVDRLIKDTTNILDGGFVKIDGVYYEDELEGVEEFTPVSEISTEKFKNEN